ncbi:hypothetical protein evm_009522 [Chilo suppressalis]|nr:hypothetical protein evm_009522 [Chilo suppressalis]
MFTCNFFVIACVLIHSATYSLGFECTKYYILLEDYYDPASNNTSTFYVRDLSRNGSIKFRTYNEKINWEEYTINKNISGLKDFDPGCVIYLNCNAEVRCVDNRKSVILNGTNERILNSKEQISKYMDELNLTEDTLQNSTKKRTITNTTERTDTSIMPSKNQNAKDNITEVFKNNGTAEHDKRNITTQDPDDIVNPSTKEYESTEATNAGKVHDSHLTTERNNTSDHQKSQDNSTTAAKIAIGILGAAASVGLILLAKKYIIGCLQSGVYNVPEA